MPGAHNLDGKHTHFHFTNILVSFFKNPLRFLLHTYLVWVGVHDFVGLCTGAVQKV